MKLENRCHTWIMHGHHVMQHEEEEPGQFFMCMRACVDLPYVGVERERQYLGVGTEVKGICYMWGHTRQ